MTFDFDRIVDRRASDSNKWQKYGPDVLPMWVADMDFASPPAVVQALRTRVEHAMFGYLAERNLLPEVIAERMGARYGWSVSPEAVVLLPGVTPGLNVAARAVARPGDGLLIQTPAYPPIQRVAGNAGLVGQEQELTRGADGRYAPDPDRLGRAIDGRTRVFLLCNPHNPVGRAFTGAELGGMAETCARHDLTILTDEIHSDLVHDGGRHVPIASLAPEVERRTITLVAPSKTFNLPGLRCAAAIIPNAALRERFVAARADLVQTPNVLGFTAALAAYRDGDPWLKALLAHLDGNRAALVRFVRERLGGVSLWPPEATYLAWLDCRQAAIPGGDPFAFFLEHARVALSDGVTFGRPGAGFVRLNFACPRAMLLDGLERMARALSGRA